MSKINLTISERLSLTEIYPQKGGLDTQMIVRDIRNKVELSKEEKKEISLRANADGSISWTEKEPICKDVEFSFTEINLLKNQVAELDKERKINQQMLDVCIKIKGVESGDN